MSVGVEFSAGQQLKLKREERKLSIAAVSDETNIQPWIIEALENDSLIDRMNIFYARGFLNTYARFLQLPSDKLLKELPTDETASDSALTEKEEPIPAAWNIPWNEVAHWAKPVLLLCLVVWLVWVNPLTWFSRLKFPSLNRPQVATVGIAGHDAAVPDLRALKLDPDQPLTLSIRAKKATWIQLWSDGKLLVQQKLETGDYEHWKADKSFRVVVAKPAAVEVELNQIGITSALIGYQGRIEISHQGISRILQENS